jgi:hypothetical protein
LAIWWATNRLLFILKREDIASKKSFMDINLYIYIAKWSKRGIKSDVNGNENNHIGQTI